VKATAWQAAPVLEVVGNAVGHVILSHVATVAPVARVGVPRGRDGLGIGVAFIVLHDAADAARVVAALDGTLLLDRPLRASLARA
jgi:hypothetical protein